MLYCKHECGFLILRNQKGCAMMNKFDFMGKDAVSKMEDLMNVSRLNELLHKKEEEDVYKRQLVLSTDHLIQKSFYLFLLQL